MLFFSVCFVYFLKDLFWLQKTIFKRFSSVSSLGYLLTCWQQCRYVYYFVEFLLIWMSRATNMLPRVLSCTLYAALKQLSPKFKVPVSSSVYAPSFFFFFCICLACRPASMRIQKSCYTGWHQLEITFGTVWNPVTTTAWSWRYGDVYGKSVIQGDFISFIDLCPKQLRRQC